MSDELAIRRVIAAWMEATRAGDVEKVLKLMTPDAVFLVAGQPPMHGRDGFGAGLRALLATHRIESDSTVDEVEVCGDMAWCRTTLEVRVLPLAEGGKAMRRAGHTLSIFRRNSEGAWQLARDANMLAPVA
ncbi:YybH family protein [Pseudoduganella aquatica]|uniref:SgcJ/EcaC family oxidoreductase n=1 Tax=Pseudoduganella aquatica TaxID=2660641 RepID=A0A7X4KMK3_9BURK|nr:SgcJ/EcaC family oxidoreductase [Pseudoduganella aquatica]MYN08233.1 SgcJ/EcaC family oxidoreductase [Pseudoduganella aquatica]